MNEDSKKKSTLAIVVIVVIAVVLAYLAYGLNTPKKDKETSTNAIETTTTESLKPDSKNTAVKNNYTSNTYTVEQVALKNTAEECWTIINGNVYNITSYVPNHPGGMDEIVKICGRDGSKLFAKPMEHKEGGADNVLSGFKIGTLKQ